jgi:cell division protein FtsB
MTIVGKILAFFVLVFSVIVGVLGAFNYAARTHWAKGYDDLAKRYKVATASASAYQQEAEKLGKEKQALNDKLMALAGPRAGLKPGEDVDRAAQNVARALAEAQEQVKTTKAEMDRLSGELLAQKKKLGQAEAVAARSLKDVERRQADVEQVRRALDTETKRNTQLVKETNDMRDQMVAAQIQARSFKDMALRLEDQVQQMARDITRLRASGGTTATARRTNPPPENVEGLVKRTDASGLVTITIGSDAGVARGHTMEVFRLGATPRYIGTIKILDVTHTQAVGQPAGRLNGRIEVGDKVASRILGAP